MTQLSTCPGSLVVNVSMPARCQGNHRSNRTRQCRLRGKPARHRLPSGVNQGSAQTSSNWTRAGANGSLEKSGTRLITRFIAASLPRETTIFHAKAARLSLPVSALPCGPPGTGASHRH
jgi:hypothetical protein